MSLAVCTTCDHLDVFHRSRIVSDGECDMLGCGCRKFKPGVENPSP